MSTLYASGANQYFDAVALHPYTYPALPSFKAVFNYWQEILTVRKLMIDNGDEAKKIWITEFGAPTGGPGHSYNTNQLNGFEFGVDFMTEGAQLEILTEASEFYHQYAEWTGPFFWYSLKDNSNETDTSENFFGLLRSDGSKKPAYDVFRNIISSSQ